EESVRFFAGRAFVAGNPVRPGFFGGGDDEHRLPREAGAQRAAQGLVFGGSQGGHAINMALVGAAPRRGAASPELALTRPTGARDLEMVRDGYRRAGLTARVEPFLYTMDREMRTADLVVCRAGATTLAELTAAGRPSILIPLPTAADDHQRKNAEALVAKGAARMMEQRSLTGELLASEIVALAENDSQRAAMSTAARRMARPDAAKVIVDRMLELAGRAW